MHPFAAEFIESVELYLCTPFLMTWHHACDKRTRLIFWDTMPCSLVSTFQRKLLHLSSGFMKFFSEDWGSRFCLNVDTYLPDSMVSQSEDWILIFTALKTPNPKKEQLYLYLNIHSINGSSAWIHYVQSFSVASELRWRRWAVISQTVFLLTYTHVKCHSSHSLLQMF
jgi:hypothetical protein